MSTRRPLRLLSIPTIGARRLRESSFIQKAGVRSNTSRVNTSFVTITVTATATVTAIQTGNLPERPLPQRPSLVGRSHPSFGGHGFLKSEIPFGLNQLGCAPLGAATLSWNSSVCLWHNMSEVGQTEKNSLRANVFRVTPESGHCSMQSACLKGATKRYQCRPPAPARKVRAGQRLVSSDRVQYPPASLSLEGTRY